MTEESIPAALAALRGNKTDAELEAWRFMRATCRNGAHCADCRKELTPDEPLWRVRKNIGRGFVSMHRHMIVPVCSACFKATYIPIWSHGEPYHVYRVRQYSRTPKECEGCGRSVHDPWMRAVGKKKRVFCCENCQRKAELRSHRQARANARNGRQCEECGETFEPTRSDAKFCGGACKQKAYRKRYG
jgi:hypothetical protein